jgi:hypothetical protein
MQYNTSKYNEQQYQYELLSEQVTLSDNFYTLISKTLNDSAFLNDYLTKQVTNKGLSDSVRVSEWFLKDRNNSSNWSD